MTKESSKMITELTDVLTEFLGEGQSTEINSKSMHITFEKKNASQIQPMLDYGGGQIIIPPVCQLIGGDCSNRVITQQVVILKYL
jgi:hypothetical protein